MVLEKSSSTTIRARDTNALSIFHALQACSIASNASRRAVILAGQFSFNSADPGGFSMMITPSRFLGLAVGLAIGFATLSAQADDAIGQVKTAKGDVKVLRHGSVQPLAV